MKKIFLSLLLLNNFSLGANKAFIEPNIAKNLLGHNQFKMYEDSLNLLKQNKEKKLTVFYLTSTSIAKGAKSFDRLIQKLNDSDKEVQGFIVLRGFTDTKTMMDFLVNAYDSGVKGTLKIHPLIFDTFNVQRVPAFALSYCPSDDNFAFKECDNKFLTMGDITLTDFFRMVSSKDKKYESYYFKLIEAK